MKDCNGILLSTGDLVQVINGDDPHGQNWRGESCWGIGAIVPNSTGPCRICHSPEVAVPFGGSQCACGCRLLKISPDANQFEQEREKEVMT